MGIHCNLRWNSKLRNEGMGIISWFRKISQPFFNHQMKWLDPVHANSRSSVVWFLMKEKHINMLRILKIIWCLTVDKMKEFLTSSESLNTNLTQIKISQRGKGLQINLVSNKQIRVFCQTLKNYNESICMYVCTLWWICLFFEVSRKILNYEFSVFLVNFFIF